MTTRTDERWMSRCLELAVRAEGRTHPNPMVGAVLVRKGEVVGEGYHHRAGAPHAEVLALRKAGELARGATLFVSLEPCNHRGQTPPCTEAIVAAGVRRVVYAADDPIAGHGGGAAALRRAKIRVTRGVLAGEALEQNRGFFTAAERGRPFVVGKVAMSADGKIATRTGHSQWITGPESRRVGHQLRNRLDGIAVGVGTVRADDPQLTTRAGGRGRDPVRVVFDSKLRTPSSARVLPANTESRARCIVVTRSDAPAAAEKRLVSLGADVVRIRGGRGGRVHEGRALSALADPKIGGLTTLLVEGGAELHGSLIGADLIDELHLFVAPLVIGGPAPSWAGGSGARTLEQAAHFHFTHVTTLGSDLHLQGRVLRS